MGQEIECSAIIDGKADRGKAQLESDFVLFRDTTRLKLATKDLTGIAVIGHRLTLTTIGGEFALDLGPKAAVWADKLRNPKSVVDKIGVTSGMPVALLGDADPLWVAQLEAAGARIVNDTLDAAMTFWCIDALADLAELPAVAANIGDKSALWIIAPKGRRDLKDYDIIDAGRAAGLSDSKVVGFSPTHTALKFIVPLNRRAS